MINFPKIINVLLLLSFGIAISRAITLPIIAIYLSNILILKPNVVGYILGFAMLIGTLSSIYSGYVVDRFDRRISLFFSIILLGLSELFFPYASSIISCVILLIISYVVLALIDIVIKAYIASFVSTDQRIKVFSIRYTIINIGFAIGPMIGAVVVIHNQVIPFIISGIIVLLCLLPIVVFWSLLVDSQEKAIGNEVKFREVFYVLSQDKRLILFTLASILSTIVYARFSAYLSQYLAIVMDATAAYKTMAYIITTNAIIVITLQYLVSLKINSKNLNFYIVLGLIFFILSFIVFYSSNNLIVWIVAIIILSLGEIIVVPASYLFIDSIAPEDLKGSYYGVQNFSNLGAAISPALCGVILSMAQPNMMFIFLIGITFLALITYIYANRVNQIENFELKQD